MVPINIWENIEENFYILYFRLTLIKNIKVDDVE